VYGEGDRHTPGIFVFSVSVLRGGGVSFPGLHPHTLCCPQWSVSEFGAGAWCKVSVATNPPLPAVFTASPREGERARPAVRGGGLTQYVST